MKNKTIVMIEDHPVTVKLIRTLLTLANYQVVEANTAEAGIELIRKEKPVLVLMDIQLPKMDGLSATRIIKKDPALKEIPVIALTSYAMEGDKEKALEAGCEGYISKPVDTRTFADTLAGFIRHNGYESSPEALGNNPSVAFPTGSPEDTCLNLHGSLMQRGKILIVDDDPRNVKLLMGKLSSEKYEILKAYSGEEALDKAYRESPDLILLDVLMPGMDGYEVTGILKTNPDTRDIPIILVTALGGTEDKLRGLNTGADEFLNKPVDTEELKARVRSLLRLKTYQEQLTARTQSEQAFMEPMPGSTPADVEKDIYSILLVEDNNLDAKIIRHCLSEEGIYHIELARNGEEAMSSIRKRPADLILLDIGLPDMDGFEVCRQLKAMDDTRNIQIVMVTALGDIESKIRGIELGADDFLKKPFVKEELTARVRALLRKKSYLDALNARFETALQAAITDKLTQLYNHTYFKHYLKREITRSLRQSHSLALIMVDVDNFKNYNDTRGHLAGDEVLRKTSQIIRDNIRDIDLAARYGGEELAVVLPYADREDAVSVAERVRQAIADYRFPREDPSLPPDSITVSMGIAFIPADASTPDELIREADKELYRAKKEGKNRVCTTEDTPSPGDAPQPLPRS